jgi:hypothetical protein
MGVDSFPKHIPIAESVDVHVVGSLAFEALYNTIGEELMGDIITCQPWGPLGIHGYMATTIKKGIFGEQTSSDYLMEMSTEISRFLNDLIKVIPVTA